MTLTYRRGTPADSYNAFLLFEESLADLLPRLGINPDGRWNDPDKLARTWEQRRTLFDYLARHADQFWIAEQDSALAGYARSVLGDGVRELTEFFVKPGSQSGGVGRELLTRAFPHGGARQRIIIATPDLRAQARYLKLGIHRRTSLTYFYKQPDPSTTAQGEREVPEGGVTPARITAPAGALDALDSIDRAILGYTRRAQHEFLLQNRAGFFYQRDGAPAGYGYIGKNSGPFALLDPADFPAVLAHAEAESAAQGHTHFGMEVPMTNTTAVDYLLANGFQMDGFIAFVMSDQPLDKLDRYILTSPPFVL
jgi:ribosomal protein S18 acetylase RimI-like enzyme